MRRLSLLALCVGFLAVDLAGSAGADPLIAGCCDSITSEPSYLDLVWDEYGWPPDADPYVHNLGVDASWSIEGLKRLETYLATKDPDAVILLSGTPDTFFDKPEGGNWGPGEGYIESVTVGHIEHMVDATVLDGGEPIIVAPPPVLDDCTRNVVVTCAEIDARFEGLSVALDNLAYLTFNDEVAFVDLWTFFNEHPDISSLYNPDHVHPNHAVGDPYILDALQPALADIFCGNGSPNPGEECDDGNNLSGDGCSATCVIEECADGLDNDADGLIDHPDDPGCADASDLSERSPLLVCDDGADNDGDELIDFPSDPGCEDPLDGSESSPTPAGDIPMCKSKRGKEMTVLVPPTRVPSLLAKGLAVGECPAAANGVVMCKSKRGKLKSMLVPHSKVQRSLDKGLTLGVCRAL